MRPYKSIFKEGIESEKVGDNKFYFTDGTKKVFLDKKFKQLLKGVNANMSLEDAGKKIEDNMLEYEDTHDEVPYEGMELSIKIGQTEYFYSDGWEMKESLVTKKKSLREGFNLQPFTKGDWYAFADAKRPESGVEPMLGYVDIYVDAEDRLTKNILDDTAGLYNDEEVYTETPEGDYLIPDCPVIVDAYGATIVHSSLVDFTIQLSTSYERAFSIVKSKFFKTMYFSDLKKLGFKIL